MQAHLIAGETSARRRWMLVGVFASTSKRVHSETASEPPPRSTAPPTFLAGSTGSVNCVLTLLLDA